jgi:lipopolysaccharide/colanic/teichoic acid biosynthesis glycosyltransferase
LGIVAAVAILITMGQPVLFTQRRIGKGGAPFTMYKLRTMAALGLVESRATVIRDPRITPLGKLLRRFRIDELPQLINVLRGEMSLIGPRPEQPLLTERYIVQMPAFSYRHLVKPGITGWAQVNAGYAANLAETKLKLEHDLFYIKNYSLALDLQILVRTLVTLAGGGGAR